MPVESDADRAMFLSSDEFGTEATYISRAGTVTPIASGIFNNPHIDVDSESVSVSDSRPTFLCRSSDLPSDASGGDDGDQIKIGSDRHRVVDLQPDGTGMTLLTLAIR